MAEEYRAPDGRNLAPAPFRGDNARVDTFLAIVSKRDWRRFSDRPVPEAVERRILEAGRITSSASNKQHRRFVVVEDPGLRERLAQTVYAPGTSSARRS